VRYCLTPQCPNLVEGRRVTHCPEHAQTANNWDRKKQERSSSGWEWGSIRTKVLRRDRRRCQIPGCRAAADEVDHVIPRHKGGTDELTNLRAICARHHRIKSEQERIEALRSRGA
jgi:5-methylcytosine-specific restriction protein A